MTKNQPHEPASLTASGKQTVHVEPVLWYSGIMLVLIGLLHFLVWFVLGGSWEGPVSWRKPILFGISTGATLMSIAWIFPKLKPSQWNGAVSKTLSTTLVLEVTLITIQQWRGKASHFNHETTLDGLIEHSMTAFIIAATLMIVFVTIRAFVFLSAPRDQQLAIRAGMSFLILSCMIGFWVLFNGQAQVAANLNPSTFGKEGVTKFPHGVTIHAIQFLPLLGWLFFKLGIPLGERVRLIKYTIVVMATFLTFSISQTAQGKARFDVSWDGTVLLAIMIAFLIPVAKTAVKEIFMRRKQVVDTLLPLFNKAN